jgi:5-oxoprolinase (ATP-hydrolysing) subunit A
MDARADLNADMGESFGRWTLGDDEALMPHLTSANIACGYHGGDPHVMRATVALAKRHGVGLGAHVSFPDLMGFGRRRMLASPAEVKDYIVYQTGALWAFARGAGARLQHVKPHGAMYVMASADDRYARAVVEAVSEIDPELILLLTGEAVRNAAQAGGVRFVPEGYVDLDYAADGSLILERAKKPRDPQTAAAKAVRLIREGKVLTADGTDLALAVQSICVHGDAPNAPEIARAIRDALRAAEIDVVPLAQLV